MKYFNLILFQLIQLAIVIQVTAVDLSSKFISSNNSQISYPLCLGENGCVCSQQCLQCVSSEICTICEPGYFLFVTPDNQVTCLICPFFDASLLADQYQCGDCVQNPSTWQSQRICSFGYLYEGDNRKNQLYNFTYNDPQFYLIKKNSDTFGTTISIEGCVANRFTQFNQDFRFNSQKKAIRNQNLQALQTLCTQCLPAYYLSATGICEKCNREISNCNECQNSIDTSGNSKTLCTQCETGFYQSNNDTSCLSCALKVDSCISCQNITTGFSCLTCQVGYTLNSFNQNQCIKLQYCVDNSNTRSQTTDNTVKIIKLKIQIQPLIFNYLNYQNTNFFSTKIKNAQCAFCFNQVAISCKVCNTQTSLCTSDNCFPDEFLSVDVSVNRCVPCKKKFPNSNKCTSTAALGCDAGYKLDLINTYCIPDVVVTNCNAADIIASPFYNQISTFMTKDYFYFPDSKLICKTCKSSVNPGYTVNIPYSFTGEECTSCPLFCKVCISKGSDVPSINKAVSSSFQGKKCLVCDLNPSETDLNYLSTQTGQCQVCENGALKCQKVLKVVRYFTCDGTLTNFHSDYNSITIQQLKTMTNLETTFLSDFIADSTLKTTYNNQNTYEAMNFEMIVLFDPHITTSNQCNLKSSIKLTTTIQTDIISIQKVSFTINVVNSMTQAVNQKTTIYEFSGPIPASVVDTPVPSIEFQFSGADTITINNIRFNSYSLAGDSKGKFEFYLKDELSSLALVNVDFASFKKVPVFHIQSPVSIILNNIIFKETPVGSSDVLARGHQIFHFYDNLHNTQSINYEFTNVTFENFIFKDFDLITVFQSRAIVKMSLVTFKGCIFKNSRIIFENYLALTTPFIQIYLGDVEIQQSYFIDGAVMKVQNAAVLELDRISLTNNSFSMVTNTKGVFEVNVLDANLITFQGNNFRNARLIDLLSSEYPPVVFNDRIVLDTLIFDTNYNTISATDFFIKFRSNLNVILRNFDINKFNYFNSSNQLKDKFFFQDLVLLAQSQGSDIMTFSGQEQDQSYLKFKWIQVPISMLRCDSPTGSTNLTISQTKVRNFARIKLAQFVDFLSFFMNDLNWVGNDQKSINLEKSAFSLIRYVTSDLPGEISINDISFENFTLLDQGIFDLDLQEQNVTLSEFSLQNVTALQDTFLSVKVTSTKPFLPFLRVLIRDSTFTDVKFLSLFAESSTLTSLFDVNNMKVQLSNLTLQNIITDTPIFSIIQSSLVQFKDLQISNLTFTNNNNLLSLQSSIMYNNNTIIEGFYSKLLNKGIFNIKNSTFFDSDSSYIQNDVLAGGLFSFENFETSQNFTILRSNFTNNSCGDSGSVVSGTFFNSSDSMLVIDTTLFQYNQVDLGSGGAINIQNLNGQTVLILNSMFDENSAKQNGGALDISFDSLQGFKTSNIKIMNNIFRQNKAVQSGGSFSLESPFNRLDDCIILNNSFLGNNAKLNNGGAINIANTLCSNISQNNFELNAAASSGGGIFYAFKKLFSLPNTTRVRVNLAENPKINLEDNQFTKNIADIGGALRTQNLDKIEVGNQYFGNTANSFGSNNSDLCVPGEYLDSFDGSCVQCETNQYSVIYNAPECKKCDFSIMDQCQGQNIKIQPYYWRKDQISDEIIPCTNKQENCLGGFQNGDDSCAIGHIGALCQECDIFASRNFQDQDGQITKGDSYSNSGSFVCSNCGKIANNVSIIVLLNVFGLVTKLINYQKQFFFLFFFIRKGSMIISIQATLSMINMFVQDLIIKSVFKFSLNEVADLTGIIIKIFLNYMQIVSAISSFQLDFDFSYFTGVSEVTGDPVKTQAFSLDCFLKDIAPPNFPLLYFRIFWQIIMALFQIFTTLMFFFVLRQLNMVKVSIMSILSNILVYTFVYLHPSMSQAVLSLIACREIGHVSYISSNVAYLCYSSQYYYFIGFFLVPFLLVWAVILPLGIIYKLYEYKQNNLLDNSDVRYRFGFLYNQYSRSAYYWEIVKILQQLIMIFVLRFFEQQVKTKGILIYTTILVYIQFSNSFKPYEDNTLNNLDILSSNLAGFSILLGVFLHQIENTPLQIISIIILITINFLFLFQLLKCLKNHYAQKAQSNKPLAKKPERKVKAELSWTQLKLKQIIESKISYNTNMGRVMIQNNTTFFNIYRHHESLFLSQSAKLRLEYLDRAQIEDKNQITSALQNQQQIKQNQVVPQSQESSVEFNPNQRDQDHSQHKIQIQNQMVFRFSEPDSPFRENGQAKRTIASRSLSRVNQQETIDGDNQILDRFIKDDQLNEQEFIKDIEGPKTLSYQPKIVNS